MYELVASLSKSELENLFCGVVADAARAVAHLRAPLHRRAFTRTPYISRQHVETIPGVHTDLRDISIELADAATKRARRTLRLRDVDTRGDPERQEELRIDRLLSATTRAATRNEERRRHFGAVAALKQIRLRMQEHREEQQRSRYRCIVS